MRKRKRSCVRVRVERNGASVGQNLLKRIPSSCYQLALLSSFWSKHIRTIYQGHCGRRMDGLDANEKICCREEERRQHQTDTSHSVVVTFPMYLMRFSGLKRKEQEVRGGRITHTCALYRTWLHRFLLFQVWSQNQHQHHLGDRPHPDLLQQGLHPQTTRLYGPAEDTPGGTRPTPGESTGFNLFITSCFIWSPKFEHPLRNGTVKPAVKGKHQ